FVVDPVVVEEEYWGIPPAGWVAGDPEPQKSVDTGLRPFVTPVVSRREYEFRIGDFCDLDEEVFLKDQGPKSEFSYLIRKVLSVVKEVHFGHTVAFFWVNREKNQLVLESSVSDTPGFTSHRRRELGNDYMSQVAFTGKPVIVNDLNSGSQSETLGYYQNVEPVRSFVAVPIFFPRTAGTAQDPVAVMTVDCLAEDSFGPETMEVLGQFAKTISALIKSYTGKYDLLIDSEVLRSVTRLRDQMKLEFSVPSVVRSLNEETSRLVAWDYIATVLFDEGRKTLMIQQVLNRMNDGYVGPSQEVDPHHSLLATSVHTGVPKIIEDMSRVGVPRYYRAERVDSAGSAMIIPITSTARCYGALVVESKDKKTYSEADIRLLQRLTDAAAAGLEILSLTDVVNNYVLVDETTGVATRKYFMERLHDEVLRTRDFEADVTLVMVSIDSVNEHLNRYGKDGFDFVLQNVGRMIKSFVRPYDLVGRFDFNRFAVMLVNTSANDAYLWAEKVRKNIASNIINIDQKSFSVTVSVGVCGAMEETTDIDLMENANQVLSKAMEAGGNRVRVY
ncbi:MAG: sensor domain-containing diguanylate cyclase, partial [Bacteroidota bacterium]